MTNFLSLISGSSGNATLLTDGKTTILTDCGMSAKALAEKLSEISLTPADINAILLTHEHIDHTKGVGAVSRKFDIPIFASRGTFSSLNSGKIKEENIKLINAFSDFEIGTIGVLPFSISHDAKEPLGYNFFCEGKKLTIATDSGKITPEMEKCMLGSDEILIESNHDKDMLMYGEYPLYLKQRILGSLGHLSNDLTAEFSVKLLESGTKKIMLGHLSNENNTPDIAYNTTLSALIKSGAILGKDIFLSVADRHKITEF